MTARTTFYESIILDCGILQNGFARVKCQDCGHEYLLALVLKQSGNPALAGQAPSFLSFVSSEAYGRIRGMAVPGYPLRRRMQAIFQNPYGSLNPRMTAGNIVGEPLRIHSLANGKMYWDRVDELLEMVELNSAMANRYPHEFSGGQRQRLGNPKALAVQPSFIICDETISAQDVSIQAQIINLPKELQERPHFTFLFIAHNLSVVRHMINRVAVMYLGRMVETASSDDLYENPRHPYTQALMSAVPLPDPVVEGGRQHRASSKGRSRALYIRLMDVIFIHDAGRYKRNVIERNHLSRRWAAIIKSVFIWSEGLEPFGSNPVLCPPKAERKDNSRSLMSLVITCLKGEN